MKLIAVQHAVLYRTSNKNDTNDAAAIAEAAARHSMKFVPIKEVWQQEVQSLRSYGSSAALKLKKISWGDVEHNRYSGGESSPWQKIMEKSFQLFP